MSKVRKFASREQARQFLNTALAHVNMRGFQARGWADELFFTGQYLNHDARYQPKYVRTDTHIEGYKYMGIMFMFQQNSNGEWVGHVLTYNLNN